MAKYMGLLIKVESGELERAFGTDDGKIGNDAEELGKNLNLKEIEVDALATITGRQSPLCRYIKVGGRWYRICP